MGDTLANILYDDVPAEKQPFEVTDFGGANWTVAKAMDATTEIVRREVQAEAWHQRINDWLAAETKQYRDTIEHMEFLLRPFVEVELKGNKRRHLTFPSGEAGFRKAPGRLEFTDEAAALAWAKEHCPDAVKVTENVQKTPLKKHIETKGEIPDGVQLVEGEEHFYIKPIEVKKLE
jgi:phage host-nuclease inhibitor protein Gam